MAEAAPVQPPSTRDRFAVPVLAALAIIGVLATALGPWDRTWAAGATVTVMLVGAALALLPARRVVHEEPAPAVAPAEPPVPLLAMPPLVAAADVHPDPMAIVEADERGPPRVAYANYAARDQLQLRAETPLTSAVRHPRVLDRLERALERGAAGSTLYQPAGEERTWRVFTVPLPAAVGLPARALVAFRDETDARAGQRMGSDFLANASHELRTPLASLTGFIETLRGHARDDPEARERFLGIMADQASRMGRLVDDLLTLSRIELNEHVPPRGSTDLTLAVGDVLDALSPLAAEYGVSFESSLAPTGTTIEGDRDQIVQAAQNLIDNALKHAPTGSVVQVTVSVEPDGAAALETTRLGAARASLVSPVRALSGSAAVLRVRDNGPGIPREHLPRLAERFYRVDGAQGRGTGLGLAIVRHVVNRHRGGFAVESLLGAGATFTIALPLKGRDGAE